MAISYGSKPKRLTLIPCYSFPTAAAQDGILRRDVGGTVSGVDAPPFQTGKPRELADRHYPHLETKSRRQLEAYRELPDAHLFSEQWVRVNIAPEDLPGHSGARIVCARCGEGVNFGRVTAVSGELLCLPCARPELRYWERTAPKE